MSKIGSKNTRLELNFIAALSSVTRRSFETHASDLLGKPDIVFRKIKVCVFLDSDFWHGWQYSRWRHKMKNSFWTDKIERNRARDKRVTLGLRRLGWSPIRIWEHNLVNGPDKEIAQILKVIKMAKKRPKVH